MRCRKLKGQLPLVIVSLLSLASFGIFMFLSSRKTRPYLDLSCSEKIQNFRRDFKHGSFRRNSTYLVSWYDVPFFIRVRQTAYEVGFDRCRYNNCEISLSRADVCKSDAVIFKGRLLPEVHNLYIRPPGQIWIFAEDEAPPTWNYDNRPWYSSAYDYQFNWTMTYDWSIADVYLPYGLILKSQHITVRDYLKIAMSKTKDAVIITSNCRTDSRRMEFITELQKYIQVDVYGSCGKPFECGRKEVHDDCFSFLNREYRYYLAFENNLCRGYRSEKFYANFNYDIMLVSRGDMSLFKNDEHDPSDAYISTSDFSSVAELGHYLYELSKSPERYAKLLENKSKYFSLPYELVYEAALCNICERLNFKYQYVNQIPRISTWVDLKNTCHEPNDI